MGVLQLSWRAMSVLPQGERLNKRWGVFSGNARPLSVGGWINPPMVGGVLRL